MLLYNTLTRNIEELRPINPPEVTVYTCGPTVYDYPHIGNWFTFVRYDILIRVIMASGFRPKWVMNITDVGHLSSDADYGEDKLAKGARREGKSAWQIADFYSNYFLDRLAKLNFINPWQTPRATAHIDDQIEFIKILEQKGFTYRIDDGIYYETSKFPSYSDFARLDLDEQQPGVRIDFNQQKHRPSDFALWKFSSPSTPRDMEWDSPWGKGFPGWHIECSTMCYKYLGDTIDIHSGGIDHIPVHHTNEIAQSEARTQHPLANIWLHTNHILINDQKISKSLGNGLTLEDLEAKGYSPEVFRLLVAESHYRTQSKFSWEHLEATKKRLLRYHNFAVRRFQTTGKKTLGTPDILRYLQNDLNSPKALSVFEEFLDQAEKTSPSKISIESSISLMDELLGLNLQDVKDISITQKHLIRERERARDENDWPKADGIRQMLEVSNITILDTPDGPVWQYIT